MSSERKVVYVSDDNNAMDKVIYGGEEQETEQEKPVDQEESVADQEEEEPVEPVEEEAEKVEPEGTEAEPEGTEAEPVEEEAEPVKEYSGFIGGGGYDSDGASSGSDVSSISTTALLNLDPLFYRLTKFLQTGGNDGTETQNVAQILNNINLNLERMNSLMTTYVDRENQKNK